MSLPLAPTGLAYRSRQGTGYLRLSWTPLGPYGEYMYNVYMSIDGDTFEIVKSTMASLTSLTVDTGHEYRFYVTAVNVEGEGPPSDILTVNL